MKRGALIVIEGIDRTGKSTQARTLVENLKKINIKAEYANFPNRNTEIGKVINSYLTSKNELSDEAIHLLFSANRWERAGNIIKTLESGTTLVVDRYCYSGVAFSSSKGLDLNWCKTPDMGLPKPDKVFFLTMPFDKVLQRNGFGGERYEVPEFQRKVSQTYDKLKDDSWHIIDANRKVSQTYDKLKDDSWHIIDANRSIEEIQKELLEESTQVVGKVDESIGKVWIN